MYNYSFSSFGQDVGGEQEIRWLKSIFHLKRNNSPSLEARLAIYDSNTSPPRVDVVCGSDPKAFIEKLAQKAYSSAAEKGCQVPYAVIREIVENLIHADFVEVVISISADGRYIRISDQGPGIPDIEKAFTPGFSTATQAMKNVIKGVGSGLSLARDFLRVSGGKIVVEKNLNSGTVVTLYHRDVGSAEFAGSSECAAASEDSGMAVRSVRDVPGEIVPYREDGTSQSSAPEPKKGPKSQAGEVKLGGKDLADLSSRQREVLKLASSIGLIGPSDVAAELGVSLSTAFRDLVCLEEKGYLVSDGAGKRRLTKAGDKILSDI